MKKLILGSSSPARKSLLNQLGIPFEVIPPNIDETPYPDEKAADLVKRLSLEKAKVIAHKQKNAIIIACDQVGEFNGEILGKPLTRASALSNLKRFSGKQIIFYSGLAVIDTDSSIVQESTVQTLVTFREITEKQINTYLSKEDALHCAGGLKVEGLGIALLQRVESEDQSALIGLPLIALCTFLTNLNYAVL